MGQENWQSIRDHLAAQIAEGQLLPGARLPPVRMGFWAENSNR